MNEPLLVTLWCFIILFISILYMSLYFINQSLQYIGEVISKGNRYHELRDKEEDYKKSKAEDYYVEPEMAKQICEFAHKRQDNPFWAGVKAGIFATTGVIKLKGLHDWSFDFEEDEEDTHDR